MAKRGRASQAEVHRASVKAGLPVGLEGLRTLAKRGDRHLFHGQPEQAVGAFRNALAFARLLLGDRHVWTSSLAGKLAESLEVLLGKSAGTEEQRLEIAELWRQAQAAFSKRKGRRSDISLVKKCNARLLQRKSLAIDLEQLKAGKHKRVGSNARPLLVRLDDLTPRSRKVCQDGNTMPAELQDRDFHSFHKVGLTYAAQVELARSYEAKRQRLLKDLLLDRWVLQQEEASQARAEAFERKADEELEERRRKRYSSKYQKNMRRAKVEPRPILAPKVSKSNAFRHSKGQGANHSGAYEAATQLAIEMEICCPNCGTLFDFRHQKCRTCTSNVDWASEIRRSEKRLGISMSSKVLVSPSYKASCFPLTQAKLAEDHSLLSNKPATTTFDLLSASRRLSSNRGSLHAKKSGKSWAAELHKARMSKLGTVEAMLSKVGREHGKEMKQLAHLNEFQGAGEKAQASRVARLYRAASQDELHSMLDGHGLQTLQTRVHQEHEIYHQFNSVP